MEILSYPGPVPPVDAQILKQNKRIVARDYRNRRIGDFLKELHLTEGRGTGFPTIYRAMLENTSPDPIFETDEQCTYFLTTLPARVSVQVSDQVGVHVYDTVNLLVFNTIDEIIAYCNAVESCASDQVSDQVSSIVSDHISVYANDILVNLKMKPMSKKSLLQVLGLSNHILNKQRHIDPILEVGWIEYTIPDNPKDRNQKYTISPSGLKLLTLLKQAQE